MVPSVPQLSPHPLTLLPGSSDEDPQAILDDHLSRVLKTPGCQSPVVICRSPRSSSPEQKPFARPGFGFKSLVRTGPSSSCVSSSDQGAITLALGPTRTLVSRQSTKHIHHHYIHHHASPKTKEQIEREAALRVHALCTGGGGGGGEGPPCPPYQRSRSLGREICGAVSTSANMGSVPVPPSASTTLIHVLMGVVPPPPPGVQALCPGECVALEPRMASPRGVWRTVDPYSCPAAPQIPLRMFCSGSWKANGKAGTSLTGGQGVRARASPLSGHLWAV